VALSYKKVMIWRHKEGTGRKGVEKVAGGGARLLEGTKKGEITCWDGWMGGGGHDQEGGAGGVIKRGKSDRKHEVRSNNKKGGGMCK